MMIKDEIKVYRDLSALSEGLLNFIKSEVMQSDRLTNISLSGGATPKTIFDYWSKNYKNNGFWKKNNYFWGDERNVPPEYSMSNYGMAKKHLLDKISVPQANVMRIQGEEDTEEEAIRYGKLLEKTLPDINGIPTFDLILLGIGNDGHTASIFPDRMDLFESDRNCEVTSHPDSGMKRVTITGRIINNAGKTAFIVTGENKAGLVKDIIRERDKFRDLYPAASVSPKTGILYWFLDEAAATLLDL